MGEQKLWRMAGESTEYLEMVSRTVGDDAGIQKPPVPIASGSYVVIIKANRNRNRKLHGTSEPSETEGLAIEFRFARG